jgi:malonyl-CoA O-methyltransferase
MQLDKRQIQRQFNRSAPSYDSVSGMQREIIDQLLPKAFPYFVRSILDAGCGTGYALNRIAMLAPDVELNGIDLAPNMLELTKRICPKANLILGDIECLPIKSGSQDVVISSSAIQWCDPQAVVEEFYRCLSSEGRLLLTTFTKGTLSSWRALWGRANQQQFIAFDDFAQLLDNNHWRDIRVWRQEFVQSLSSFAAAGASIRDLGAGDASPKRGAIPMTRSQLASIKLRADALIEKNGCVELTYQVAFISAIKSS